MIPQEYRHLLGDLDHAQQDEIFASKTPEEQAKLLEELAAMQAQYEEEHGIGLTSGEKFEKEMIDPWTTIDDDDNWLEAGGKFLGDTFLGSLPRFASYTSDKIDDVFMGNPDGIERETGGDEIMDGIFSIPVIGGVAKGLKGGVGLGGKAMGSVTGPLKDIRKWMGFGPSGSYKAATNAGSKLKRGAHFATGTLPAGLAAYGAGFDGGPDLDNPDGGANAKVVDPQDEHREYPIRWQDGDKKRAIWMDRDGDGVNDADQPGGPWGAHVPVSPMADGHATFHPGPGGAGRPPGNPIMDQRMTQWMDARDYLSNMNRPSVLNQFTGKGKLNPIDAALGMEAPDLDMAALLNYNGTLDQDNKSGIHHSMSHPINVKDVTRRGADNKRGTARELKSSLQESMDIRNEIAHRNLMKNRHKVTEGYEGAYREWAKNNPDVKLNWDTSGEDRMRFVREIYPNLHKYNQSPPEDKTLTPTMPEAPDLDNPGGEEDGDGISPWWALLGLPAAYWLGKKFLGRKGAKDLVDGMSGSGGGGVRPPRPVRPGSGSGGGGVSSPASGSGGGGVSSPASGSSGGRVAAGLNRNPRTFGDGLSGSGGGRVGDPNVRFTGPVSPVRPSSGGGDIFNRYPTPASGSGGGRVATPNRQPATFDELVDLHGHPSSAYRRNPRTFGEGLSGSGGGRVATPRPLPTSHPTGQTLRQAGVTRPSLDKLPGGAPASQPRRSPEMEEKLRGLGVTPIDDWGNRRNPYFSLNIL